MFNIIATPVLIQASHLLYVTNCISISNVTASKNDWSHAAIQDIFTLFHLNRSFKFVSKTSNFLIPIIGWSMFLTGKAFMPEYSLYLCSSATNESI